MKFQLPVICALLTALFWALYGPTLAEARTDLKSPFKPYVAIGLAYLVWGVFGGVLVSTAGMPVLPPSRRIDPRQ